MRSDLKIQPFSQVFKSNNKRCCPPSRPPDEIRLYLALHARCNLLVGPSGLEPPTLRLSVVRSSQLSYGPITTGRAPSKLNNVKSYSPAADQDVIQKPWLLEVLLRKEVIQPLVLERLPCYDFTPIIEPTFGRALLFRLGYGLRVFPTLMV